MLATVQGSECETPQEPSPSPLFHAGPGAAQALGALHHPWRILNRSAAATGGAGRAVPPVSAQQAPAGAGGTPRSPRDWDMGTCMPGLSSASVVLQVVGASETHDLGVTRLPELEEVRWQEEVAGTPG